jgi:hypothetical protein
MSWESQKFPLRSISLSFFANLNREFFCNRIKGWHSTETCKQAPNSSHDLKPCRESDGHEPRRLGWHPLKGDLSGHWSVTVNGNWRLTFSFEGEDAILVDYQDYH